MGGNSFTVIDYVCLLHTTLLNGIQFAINEQEERLIIHAYSQVPSGIDYRKRREFASKVSNIQNEMQRIKFIFQSVSTRDHRLHLT